MSLPLRPSFQPCQRLVPSCRAPKAPALCVSPFVLEFFVFHLWGVDEMSSRHGGTGSRQAALPHVPLELLTLLSQNALHLSNLSWLTGCLSSLTRTGTSWGRNTLVLCTAVSLTYRTVLSTLKELEQYACPFPSANTHTHARTHADTQTCLYPQCLWQCLGQGKILSEHLLNEWMNEWFSFIGLEALGARDHVFNDVVFHLLVKMGSNEIPREMSLL